MAPSFAQSAGQARQDALEAISIDDIPLPGYDEPRPGDAPPITKADYTYEGLVYEIRDADTVKGFVNVGYNLNIWFGYRYYGLDTFEITQKGGKTKSHVDRGYKCRDLMVQWLGSDEVFPRKSIYHKFKQPIPVIVQSVAPDKYSGRWLFIIHKDGKNLNQLAARAGCGVVTTFESSTPVFDRDTPITPDLGE